MASKRITIDDLAMMVNKGFEEARVKLNDVASKNDIGRLEVKLDGLDAKINRIETNVNHTDARVSSIETDIHEMTGNTVHKYDFEDLSARVKYIETKVGIESGK